MVVPTTTDPAAPAAAGVGSDVIGGEYREHRCAAQPVRNAIEKSSVYRAYCRVCADICEACAAECAQHAHHEHCRICAD
jgi:hypothetical protein